MNEERRLALRGPYHVSRHVTDTVNGQLSEVQSNKSHISNPKLAKASKRVLLKPAQRGEGRWERLVTDLGCKSITKVKKAVAKVVCSKRRFEAEAIGGPSTLGSYSVSRHPPQIELAPEKPSPNATGEEQ